MSNIGYLREALPVEKKVGTNDKKDWTIWVDANTILGDGTQSSPFRVDSDYFVPKAMYFDDFNSLDSRITNLENNGGGGGIPGPMLFVPFSYTARVRIPRLAPGESITKAFSVPRWGAYGGVEGNQSWLRIYNSKFDAEQDISRLPSEEYKLQSGLIVETFGEFSRKSIGFSAGRDKAFMSTNEIALDESDAAYSYDDPIKPTNEEEIKSLSSLNYITVKNTTSSTTDYANVTIKILAIYDYFAFQIT